MKENKKLIPFEFPIFVSLKEIGESVEGKFLELQENIPTSNGYVNYVILENELGEKFQFVATAEILKFFRQFKKGFYAKVTRKGTLSLPNGRKKGTYRFEYENGGLIVQPPNDDLPF